MGYYNFSCSINLGSVLSLNIAVTVIPIGFPHPFVQYCHNLCYSMTSTIDEQVDEPSVVNLIVYTSSF
jgi:hypothetical protein